MSLGVTSTVYLTTQFTPPSNCAKHWTYEPSATDGNDIPGGLLLQRAQGPPVAPDSALDPTCYPELGNNWGRYPATTFIFRPGICPSDYTAAVQSLGSVTTETCCPTGFAYTSTLGTLNGGSTNVVFYGCTSQYYSDGTPTSVFAISPYGSSGTLDNTVGSVTTITGPIIMWAQPITVAYDQEDASLFTTTTPSPNSSSTRPGTTSSPLSSNSVVIDSSTPTPLPTQQSSPSLSSGAIAGIVIGGVAAVSLAAGAFFLLMRKKAKRSPAEISSSSFTTPSSFGSSFEPYKDNRNVELETSPVQSHQMASLPNPRYELQAGSVRGR